MFVAVLSASGKRLMPTTPARARQLLKKGRAIKYAYEPVFAIQLVDRKEGNTQPIEYSCDTGKTHVGVSVKSEKHEYVSATYDMLHDEKERHDACRRYRRTRRNRLRYRKPRFNNRSKQNKKFAPSIRHIEENQIRVFEQFCNVMPITTSTWEMGLFDTALLVAMEAGRPIPEGKGYQHGYQYQMATLRKAVLYRDNYTCQCCGRSIKDGAILCVHHLGFWYGDHSNRIDNLITVCTDCHTSKNHKKGGKLYGWTPKVKRLDGAAYMNTVRWDLYAQLVTKFPDIDFHMQYGAKTAQDRHEHHFRKDKNDLKNHAVDAYCIGSLHPKHRAHTYFAKKRRRNNRVLSKFYDAKYVDIRDGSVKSGSQLGCNRTNRREPRNSAKNERCFRARRTTNKRGVPSKGRRSVRIQHYQYQPGDIVICDDRMRTIRGVHNGKNYEFEDDGRLPKSASASRVRLLRKVGGWRFLTA